MIVKVEVSQEDFEASIRVFDVFDDSVQRYESIFVVSAKEGVIEVAHIDGWLQLTVDGAVPAYGKEIVKTAVRIFKAIYTNWKEF